MKRNGGGLPGRAGQIPGRTVKNGGCTPVHGEDKTCEAAVSEYAGIYVHIPFCVQKCIYCDFYSVPGCSHALQSGYFGALKQEIASFLHILNETYGTGRVLRAPACAENTLVGSAAESGMKSAVGQTQNERVCAESLPRQTQDALAWAEEASEQTQNKPACAENVSADSDAFAGRKYFADTLFIGGGTPSSVNPALIEELVAWIRTGASRRNSLPVQSVGETQGGGCIAESSDHTGVSSRFDLLAPDAEITMELNPGTGSLGNLRRYRNAGINRLSIGVQSFCDKELKFLGRIHTAADAEACIRSARQAGFDNINIDLIFGFPGNTPEEWRRTLHRAVNLRPEHISFYSLQIEDGTPLYRMFCEDIVDQVSDRTNRLMYHDALEILTKAGYHHYEISNAALSGKECRHNLKYWSMADYAGFGASAHSYLRKYKKLVSTSGAGPSYKADEAESRDDSFGIRFFNEDDINRYIKRINCCRGGYVPLDIYENSLRDEITDTLFTELRKIEGMDLKKFDSRFAPYDVTFASEFAAKAAPFLKDGFLEIKEEKLRFTLKGLDISNYILARLF